MKTKAVLTDADVSKILAASKAHANKNNWAVTIAVVDDGGHLFDIRNYCNNKVRFILCLDFWGVGRLLLYLSYTVVNRAVEIQPKKLRLIWGIGGGDTRNSLYYVLIEGGDSHGSS